MGGGGGRVKYGRVRSVSDGSKLEGEQYYWWCKL